jgi:excinuclease UvrABC nuclease subunit
MSRRWISFNDDQQQDIPGVPGCYVIYLDGALTYIGQSCNVRDRIRSHGIRGFRYSAWIKTPWGNARNVRIKVRPSSRYGDWAMIELRLIKRLRPAGNRRGIERVAA